MTLRTLNCSITTATRKLLSFCSADESVISYRADWAWYLGVLIARLLEYPLFKMRNIPPNRIPSSLSIGIAFILAYIPVTLFVAWQFDALLPNQTTKLSLVKDTREIAYMVIFPIVAAAIFSFYKQASNIFLQLQSHEIIIENQQGAFQKLWEQINQRGNHLLWLLIFLVPALFIAFSLDQRAPNDIRWFSEVSGRGDLASILVRVWLGLWTALGWVALLFFILKGVIIWIGINRLCKSKEFEWDIQPNHPDGLGGLKPLASFWLRVQLIVGLLGVYLIGYSFVAAAKDALITLGLLFPIFLYAVFAPILLFSTVIAVHGKMKVNKTVRTEETYKLWMESRNSIDETGEGLEGSIEVFSRINMRSREYEAAQHLPTWPIGWRRWGLYFTTYLFPIVISLVAVVFNDEIKAIF